MKYGLDIADDLAGIMEAQIWLLRELTRKGLLDREDASRSLRAVGLWIAKSHGKDRAQEILDYMASRVGEFEVNDGGKQR